MFSLLVLQPGHAFGLRASSPLGLGSLDDLGAIILLLGVLKKGGRGQGRLGSQGYLPVVRGPWSVVPRPPSTVNRQPSTVAVTPSCSGRPKVRRRVHPRPSCTGSVRSRTPWRTED